MENPRTAVRVLRINSLDGRKQESVFVPIFLTFVHLINNQFFRKQTSILTTLIISQEKVSIRNCLRLLEIKTFSLFLLRNYLYFIPINPKRLNLGIFFVHAVGVEFYSLGMKD